MEKSIKMLKNSEKAITLISLVVTIIVLLILAGISISMLSGDNSILQKATDSKEHTERAEAKEQAQMDIMAWITDKTANHQDSSLDDTKIKGILTGKSYVKEAKASSFLTAKGEYEISYSELYTANGTTPMATIPAGTYTAGQEIVCTGTQFELLTNENANSGEHFFVVADDGNSVIILSKYCLIPDGTVQTDKDTVYEVYGRDFSSSNYWSSTFTSSPYDLQTVAEITLAENNNGGYVNQADGIKNAVLTAKDYGETKGVTGRLMTKAEADEMVSNNSEIMYGKWTDGTQPTQGYLLWWLGDANNDSNVWRVYGNISGMRGFNMFNPSGQYLFGVRPILIVPES